MVEAVAGEPELRLVRRHDVAEPHGATKIERRTVHGADFAELRERFGDGKEGVSVHRNFMILHGGGGVGA